MFFLNKVDLDKKFKLLRKELKVKLQRTLGEAEGNIQIFVLCNACIALREIIGKYVVPPEMGTVIV